MKELPIVIGKDLRYLVPSKLESQLIGAGVYTKQDKGWSSKARDKGIFFDLSSVEWLDIGAIVQVALLVESALLNNIEITVALPFLARRHSEQEWFNGASVPLVEGIIDWRLARRIKTFEFLGHFRFEQALRPVHTKSFHSNLKILAEFDTSLNYSRDELNDLLNESNEDDQDDRNHTEESLYKNCFPLKWLASDNRVEREELASFLSNVIGSKERGLSVIDSDAISNVILYELIDNVKTHAGGSGYSLITAWATPKQVVFHSKNYIDCERSFLEWLGQQDTPIVDIIVGDSGQGIPRSLDGEFRRKYTNLVTKSKPAEIIRWAFDRWSSSDPNSEHRRGTRGLYRVQRIVQKYQGMISVRSENKLAGFDHGGANYDEPIENRQKLSYVPGTLLRVRLKSVRQLSTSIRGENRPPRKATWIDVRLGRLTTDGLSDKSLSQLRRAFKKSTQDTAFGVIGIVEGGTDTKQAIEETLRQAAEIRHPSTLILSGFPCGWATLEQCINSVNEEHTKYQRAAETIDAPNIEVWDPVLILGPGSQIGWVGATPEVRAVLEELILSSKGSMNLERLENLVGSRQKVEDVLQYFRSDTNLIRINPNTPSELLVLRITISELVAHIKKRLKDYLKEPGGAGVLPHGLYRTPSLVLVKTWLETEQIIDKTIGFDLVMYGIAQLVRAHKSWNSGPKTRMVLSDASVSSRHVEALKNYLGIRYSEMIPGETGVLAPSGNKIIPDEVDEVLIYCDVMGSTEAVGRCLRRVRREGKNPTAIVCLFDVRSPEKETAILLRDLKVPVISLVKVDHILENSNKKTPVQNINPVTLQPEKETRLNVNYFLSRREIYKLVRKNDALHFNHIGRRIGRHFTFYLDASRLANEKIILDALKKAISQSPMSSWEGLKEFELWFPFKEPMNDDPTYRLAENIRQNAVNVKTKPFRRQSAYGRWYFSEPSGEVSSSNVVIIDWGSLTGNTIIQSLRLAASKGANQIFVCILFSQLPIQDEAFLVSLKALEVRRKLPLAIKSQELLPFMLTDDDIIGEMETASPEVHIRFLGHFPMEAYSIFDCPVCEQMVRLSQERYPTKLLKNFRENQLQKRLRLRNRADLSSADYEIPEERSRAFLWMLYFRGRLSESLTSTDQRQKISNDLSSLKKRITSDGCSSKNLKRAFWLLHFLAVESQWLRRPPLYLRKLRGTIGKIALHVATNPQFSDFNRLNAIVVLRTSDKDLFVKNLANLFFSISNSDELRVQIIYDAFTYLARPYHQLPSVLLPLEKQLLRIQSEFDQNKILVTPQNRNQILQTIDILLQRTSSERARADIFRYSPLESWIKLRHILSQTEYVHHSPIPSAFLRLFGGKHMKDVETQIQNREHGKDIEKQVLRNISEWLSDIRKDWVQCCHFLDRTILPFIARLSDVFRSEEAKRHFGQELEPIISLVDVLDDGKAPTYESDFSILINDMYANPEIIFERTVFEKFKAERDWYYETFLRPHPDPDVKKYDSNYESKPAASLITFLSTAPTVLGDILRTSYERQKDNLPRDHKVSGLSEVVSSELKVFCNDFLLRDTIQELLLNITRHTLPEAQVSVLFAIDKNDDEIELHIMNDNSKTTAETAEEQGEGLQRLRDRLTAFGATIVTPETRNSPNYKATVIFKSAS